ncbi:MAG: phage tail tape measure protein [Roseivirga sp.]|nr:phage tail tape measure protein [Roseivirga sp.]
MQKANKEVIALGRTMQSTGRNLTTKITLPILALGGASTKLAIDFDESMTKIQTLVGLSSEVVNGFKDDVLELAGKTGQAPAVLADALFTVTSAGLRGAESMEVLEMAAKGAAVGMGETKEIARAVTSVIQAYGKENINAATAMDILTATVREGNLEAGELAPVLGRVIGLSSQLGIGFDQVGASIATFTRLGVDSSEAVTGLRGLLSSLISPSRAGADALAEVGTTFGEVRKEINEKGLSKTLIKLVNTFKGNEEALSTVIPNVRALSAVLGTAGSQGKEYLKISDSITNSTNLANKAFEETANSGAFKIKSAWNEILKVGTEIGVIVLPVVADLAESVKELFERFSNLNPATQTMIIKVAALTATVGPLMLGVGSMITGFGKLLGVLRVLGTFIAANPWFALAAGVAAVVVAIGSYNSVSKVFAKSAKVQASALEQQQSQLNFLVGELISVNDNEEKRSKLITEINSKYPDFLKGLDTEKVSIKQLTDRLGEFNKEFERKIKLKAAEEEAIDVTKFLADAEAELRSLKTVEGMKAKLAEFFNTNDIDKFREEADEKGLAQIEAWEEQFLINAENSVARARAKLKELREKYNLLGGLFGDDEKKSTVDTDALNAKFSGKKKVTPSIDLDVFDLNDQIEKLLGDSLGIESLFDLGFKPAVSDLEFLRSQFDDLMAAMGPDHPMFAQALSAWAMLDEQILQMGLDSLPQVKEEATLLESVLSSAFTGLGEIVTSVFNDMLEGTKVTVGGIVKELGKMIVKLLIAAAAAAALRAILGDGSAAKDGATAAKGIGATLKTIVDGFGGFRADGGPVALGKSYIVGERGPEVFTPSQSGQIIPNHSLGGMVGGLRVEVVGAVPLVWDGNNLSGMISQENIRVRRMGG